MKNINLKRTLKGLSLVAAFGFGLILLTGTDVSAQGRGRQDNRQNDNRRDDRYNNGQDL